MLRNRDKLRAILDKAVSQPTPDTQKIGDFYASCLDEAAIEKQGLSAAEARRWKRSTR